MLPSLNKGYINARQHGMYLLNGGPRSSRGSEAVVECLGARFEI